MERFRVLDFSPDSTCFRRPRWDKVRQRLPPHPLPPQPMADLGGLLPSILSLDIQWHLLFPGPGLERNMGCQTSVAPSLGRDGGQRDMREALQSGMCPSDHASDHGGLGKPGTE